MSMDNPLKIIGAWLAGAAAGVAGTLLFQNQRHRDIVVELPSGQPDNPPLLPEEREEPPEAQVEIPQQEEEDTAR